MWVWYCRPPIGAHFYPTPQPPPVPQQLGEFTFKAHLRTVAAVLANATATTLVYPSVQGPTPARSHIGLAVDTGDGGSCRRPPLGGRTRLVSCKIAAIMLNVWVPYIWRSPSLCVIAFLVSRPPQSALLHRQALTLLLNRWWACLTGSSILILKLTFSPDPFPLNLPLTLTD